MLTINRRSDYMYCDTPIVYRSEMWSVQGMSYFYLGHVGAPIVVVVLAIIANQLYPWLHRSVGAAPTVAAFVIPLTLGIITNGTLKRNLPLQQCRTASELCHLHLDL